MSSPSRAPHLEQALLAVGITALALNLRPGALSVGPVLEEVRQGLGMSATTTGLLTALPVLCFAVIGSFAAAAARRVGMHRLTLVALGLAVVGLSVRALTASVWLFLVMSVLALLGAACANVLLPSMVKLHFPRHVGLMTATYTTALAVGLTAASAVTAPVASATGSWRWGLGMWALLAAVAVLPWLGLLRHDERPEGQPERVRFAQVARTRLGWAMVVLFGMQSLQAYVIFGWVAQIYRDGGLSANHAGVLLGIITGISIPLSFVAPWLAGRMEDQTWLMLGLIACYPVGYAGLMLAPATAPWLWAVILGVGASLFPLVLTQLGLRARTHEGTAALSGFSQSLGYLIAGLGPFGVGVAHDLTGGWTVPLVALILTTVPLSVSAAIAGRPRYLEDELAVRTSVRH